MPRSRRGGGGGRVGSAPTHAYSHRAALLRALNPDNPGGDGSGRVITPLPERRTRSQPRSGLISDRAPRPAFPSGRRGRADGNRPSSSGRQSPFDLQQSAGRQRSRCTALRAARGQSSRPASPGRVGRPDPGRGAETPRRERKSAERQSGGGAARLFQIIEHTLHAEPVDDKQAVGRLPLLPERPLGGAASSVSAAAAAAGSAGRGSRRRRFAAV